MKEQDFISQSNSVEPQRVATPNHCDHKITLLNGNTLQCYPKSGESEISANQRELFISNAFTFWENRELILSDSRMFLCQVGDMGHNLSITGSSGFENPTLGVYIEWWLSVPGTMLINAEGRQSLVYMIAGSP